MVDALASGASVRMDVEVRVLSWAPNQDTKPIYINYLVYFCRWISTLLSTFFVLRPARAWLRVCFPLCVKMSDVNYHRLR